MNKSARIYVAGHRGLVGSAIVRRLYSDGYENLLLRSRSELDLRRQTDVNSFFADKHPEYVFLAAARVGGIAANIERPADFLLDNILIEANVIDAAYRSGAKKLLFLASSCCYPRLAPQPMREESLLNGLPEPTNQAYAIAKLAGLELVSSYRRQHGFQRSLSSRRTCTVRATGAPTSSLACSDVSTRQRSRTSPRWSCGARGSLVESCSMQTTSPPRASSS